MGHDHQTGDWRDVRTNATQLARDAKWHRDQAERIRARLATMTPDYEAAIGAAAVLQQQRDRRLHLQLAEELESYLAGDVDEHQVDLF